MNLRVIVCWAIGLIALAIGGQASAMDIQAGQIWVNQRGSKMTITSVDGSGKVTGTYATHEVAKGCEDIKDSPKPLIGWYRGGAFTFTVDFNSKTEGCWTLSSWTGRLYLDSFLVTSWRWVTSTYDVSDSGNDYFKLK